MQLKEFIQEHNIYAAEIAKLAGCHPQTIRYIASKKRFPSAKLAAKISQITEGYVSYEELHDKPKKQRCPHCNKVMNVNLSLKLLKKKKQK